VQLRPQNRKLAHVNGNNNITGVNLGRGGVVWLRRFLGRGRNGMWLSRLALFALRTWNQNSSFFLRWKILECSPYSCSRHCSSIKSLGLILQPAPLLLLLMVLTHDLDYVDSKS